MIERCHAGRARKSCAADIICSTSRADLYLLRPEIVSKANICFTFSRPKRLIYDGSGLTRFSHNMHVRKKAEQKNRFT